MMTGRTQQKQPEMFDMIINDHIMEAKEDTERELMEHSRKAKQKKVDIDPILRKNLGPSGSETSNPSYVEKLVHQAMPSRPPPEGTQHMEVEQGGGQPPPGPPGSGATPIIASVSGGERSNCRKSNKNAESPKNNEGVANVGKNQA